jgi:UDP-N-acetylglucosamine diphosphorylase/glucosamine-1-phosphate N-acetyltransferase
MTKLLLLEPDAPGPERAPFAHVRPVCELRAGIWRIRERWEHALDLRTEAIIGPHAAEFSGEEDGPMVCLGDDMRGPSVVADSQFAPATTRVAIDSRIRRLVNNGKPVAWVIPNGERFDPGAPPAEGPDTAIEGVFIRGTVALLDALETLLPTDCEVRSAQSESATIPSASVVLGDPSLVSAGNAQVEPGVVFDVRQGPVVLDDGAEVRHGARLEGPLYVGAHTIVWGGSIRHSVIGPQCRVRGEVTDSIFLGYANKAHDGFLGHSVLGYWVNLGALTTTSNLKNTYGEVALEVAGSRIPTGRQFVGTLFGDHVKTAIGTMLGTGTVVSVGANLFGSEAVPKYVPPFAWGTALQERMDEASFLKVAGRAMPRRGVELTPERRSSLSAMYARASGP